MPSWAVWRRVGAAPRRSPSDEVSPPRSFRSTPLELERFSGRPGPDALEIVMAALAYRFHNVATRLAERPHGPVRVRPRLSGASAAANTLRPQTPAPTTAEQQTSAAMSAGRSRLRRIQRSGDCLSRITVTPSVGVRLAAAAAVHMHHWRIGGLRQRRSESCFVGGAELPATPPTRCSASRGSISLGDWRAGRGVSSGWRCCHAGAGAGCRRE
jgi:hypothetical protein